MTRLRDVRFQVGHAADRDGDLHPLVGGRDPERRRAAAADAGDGDPLGVDVGRLDEVVDAADAVPALRRRPACSRGECHHQRLEVVGAVVHGGDLAQLQRIDDQADVAVPGEPDAVRLVGHLVAVAAAAGVAADVEDGGQLLALLDLGGAVEVAGDVQARAALVVQHLDDVAVALRACR